MLKYHLIGNDNCVTIINAGGVILWKKQLH